MKQHGLTKSERLLRRKSTQLTHQLQTEGRLHRLTLSRNGNQCVRDGKRLTDGPFAETYEQLGGYFLINAKDLDEAIAIAERIPSARKGTVKIRPVVELIRTIGTAYKFFGRNPCQTQLITPVYGLSRSSGRGC